MIARMLFPLGLVIVPLVAQAPASPQATLLAADRALAAKVAAQPFASAISDAMTGNAVLVWPTAAVVRGPAVVRQLLAAQPGLGGARISWQPLHVEVAADRSLGLIWGVIALDRDTGATRTPVPRLGRFLAAWRLVGAEWKLEALAVNGVVPAAEARWVARLGPTELPALRSSGPAGRFIGADSIFAARAGVTGAAVAFAEWAAPDAVTFAASGELNVGPVRIRAALDGDDSEWQWGAVAAGASGDGSLGWTVGQATITPKNLAAGSPDVSKGKYLTLWRRMPDGTIRFIADGGSSRP